MKSKKIIRGNILHFLADPGERGDSQSYEYFEDGLLHVEEGLVQKITAFSDAELRQKDTEYLDYSGKFILPGFVDCHIHYVQTDIIASYGTQLLEWLEKYAFPAERKFEDPAHAALIADFFTKELLRNGTTSALVMGSVHKQSARSLFEAADQRNMRLVAGKVMMDRNCPSYLQDSAESSYQDSQSLISDWHGKGRLSYAVTPRFAPTSTEEQLKMAARLLKEFPDVLLHTHLAENQDELHWMAELFPDSRSYLDVYDKLGLVGDRSIFAHSIWLDDEDRRILSEKGSSIAHCPTCNLFVGSGLFKLKERISDGIQIGLATDVGGGTSFSMFKVMQDAYKIAQLQGQNLAVLQAYYLATLGGAASLSLDHKIGNFEQGKEADFIVLDPDSTEILKRRCSQTASMEEKLFALMILADDRAVLDTFLMGEQCLTTLLT